MGLLSPVNAGAIGPPGQVQSNPLAATDGGPGRAARSAASDQVAAGGPTAGPPLTPPSRADSAALVQARGSAGSGASGVERASAARAEDLARARAAALAALEAYRMKALIGHGAVPFQAIALSLLLPAAAPAQVAPTVTASAGPAAVGGADRTSGRGGRG